MPRTARFTTLYTHVIMRGIGKQIIFEDTSDKTFFIKMLAKYREQTKISILAYCLMDNHVHLLVEDKWHQLELFMRKLETTYAMYFNRKYERPGHLFQNRFKSQNVYDESYLLTVFRYILRNPEKAGICKYEDYRWSSVHEYGMSDALSDTFLLCKMIGDYAQFAKFMSEENPDDEDDDIIEADSPAHDEEWAINRMKRVLGLDNLMLIKQMPRAERNEVIGKLLAAKFTISQIERFTGISKSVVGRIKVGN